MTDVADWKQIESTREKYMCLNNNIRTSLLITFLKKIA